jgi:LmbE family N-acetylglucosaminyl deacetylase
MALPPTDLRILAIHAHPDDVEFQCAGTLARLKEAGCHVTIATMTAGDCGSAELGPAEISKVRRAEARRAADLLEADYVCLEFEDLGIVHDNDGRRRVTEAVRRARPDIVLTAPPVDYMCDHEMTSRLVRDACFAASIPNYATRQWEPAAPLAKIPHLYYVDAIAGIDYFGKTLEPEFIIDVTATFDTKLKMLACHASQRNWLIKHHGMDDYLRAMRDWSAEQGRAAGVQYAEGFRQHLGHSYPQDNPICELLGGIVRRS